MTIGVIDIRSIVPLILALVLAPVAFAQKEGRETRKQIEQRLEQRYAELLRAENQGKVGETWQGFVEAVEKSAANNEGVKKLIGDENADRKSLYEIIAAEDKVREKVTAAVVGERNAIRKFQKAKPDHFLKAKGDVWVQKRDVNRLKKDGKIGETWEGFIEAVKEGDKNERVIGAVIELENRLRRDDYQREARKRDTSVNAVAESAGKLNLEKVAAGEWYKPKDGKWTKKP